MDHSDFKLGERFIVEDGDMWQVTDIGTRTVIAIKINEESVIDPSWLDGPPYALEEVVFDEDDFDVCEPV